MKTAAAVTMLALTIALAGCTSTPTPTTPVAQPKTYAVPSQIGSVNTVSTATNMFRAIHDDWHGDYAPDKTWMTNAATIVCKQIIAGQNPVVIPEHYGNNEVVVAAAERFVCEIDR